MQCCAGCSTEYEPDTYSCPIKRQRRLIFFFSRSVAISQHYHGSTHVGELAHSIDYRVRRGTPVLAARDGLVVDVVQHFVEQQGTQQQERHKANFVCVYHAPATTGAAGSRYSRYFHLLSAGVVVGQRVLAGQELGRSGNTGYSTGPHLHFDVVDMHGSEVCEMTVGGVVVRCVPLGFSRLPFPASKQRMRAAVCRRGGGGLSFWELVQKARRGKEEEAVECVVIVDNEEDMRGAIPLLVGGGGGDMPPVYCVMVASSSSLLMDGDGGDDGVGEIELRQHPRYTPRLSSSAIVPFNKPLTLPVHVVVL